MKLLSDVKTIVGIIVAIPALTASVIFSFDLVVGESGMSLFMGILAITVILTIFVFLITLRTISQTEAIGNELKSLRGHYIRSSIENFAQNYSSKVDSNKNYILPADGEKYLIELLTTAKNHGVNSYSQSTAERVLEANAQRKLGEITNAG